MQESKPYIVLLLVIAALVLLSGCFGTASVKIESLDEHETFWIPQGCYTTLSGDAKNASGATAEEVEITCTATQQGELIDTGTKNIGSLSAGSNIGFSIDVDTDCFKGEAVYNCTASCGNCGSAADAGGGLNSITVIIFGIVLILAVAAIIGLSYKKFFSGRVQKPKPLGKAKPPLGKAKTLPGKAKTPAKCPKCSSKLIPGDKFCTKCGYRL